MRLRDHNQVMQENPIAYNAPLNEGSLELATTADILNRLGDDVHVSIQEPGTVRWIEGRDAGQEIRQLLLMALVAALLIEQMLAYRFSYHPAAAEGRATA